jgi:hypothetical protein
MLYISAARLSRPRRFSRSVEIDDRRIHHPRMREELKASGYAWDRPDEF